MKVVKKVAALIRNKKGELLVFQEKTSQTHDWRYQIPKGTFNTIDKNVSFAMYREIFEETNISKNNLRLENIVDISIKKYDDTLSILLLFSFSIH